MRSWSYLKIDIATLLLASTVCSLAVLTHPSSYQATSVVLVNTQAPGSTYLGAHSPTDSEHDVAMLYALEIPMGPVMNYVLAFDRRLSQYRYSANDLTRDVTTKVAATQPIITITASAPTRQEAVLLISA